MAAIEAISIASPVRRSPGLKPVVARPRVINEPTVARAAMLLARELTALVAR